MIDGEVVPWPDGEASVARLEPATFSLDLVGDPTLEEYVEAFRRVGASAVRATEAIGALGRQVRLVMIVTAPLARWLRASLLPRPWSGPSRGPRRRKHPAIRRRKLRT